MVTVGVVNNLLQFRNRLPQGNFAKRSRDKRNIAGDIQVTFPGGQMTHGGSNAVSVYNADQKAVIKAFGTIEKDALYLFFVEQVKSKDGDIGGYMPLQRQAGFIYDLPHNELIAHELGHGAFNLRHTFSSEEFAAAQGSTDNLMDYKGNAELWRHQWKKIQDPERILLAFLEDEGEGEMRVKEGITDKQLRDLCYSYNLQEQEDESESFEEYLYAQEEVFLDNVTWVSQFDESIFGECVGCWQSSCCRRATEYMMGNTNIANCTDSTIAKNAPYMTVTGKILSINTIFIPLNWMPSF